MTDSSPILLAFVAGLILWVMTALGASLVLVNHTPKRRLLDALLGVTAGIMLAASYWLLLAPAVELARAGGQSDWLAPALGFLTGALALWGLDKLLLHGHPGPVMEQGEGQRTPRARVTLLLFALILHRIPKGLAIGIAFAAAVATGRAAAFAAPLALTVGLGIQSAPEGVVAADLMQREGMAPTRAFLYGQATGIVEPIAAALGAAIVVASADTLPRMLGFAAGAMIFVVIDEMVPECHARGNADIATLGAIVGFVGMMVLSITR